MKDKGQPVKSLKKKILMIDDDELFGQAMLDYLQERYVVEIAASADDGLRKLTGREFDLVLLDITLPGTSGIDLLKSIRKQWPEIPVIMLTAIDRIQTVVECIRQGAFDYLAKPIITEELVTSVERAFESIDMKRELEQRRRLQLETNRQYELIGASEVLNKLRKEIEVVCRSDSSVLLFGETGTGKELAARSIHSCSSRASGPFVAINCGAVPKDLFEVEFFGHKKGAYTSAQTSEIGKFQLADHGTLLLDEISELTLDVQSKLLRVLEEQEFYPVGGTELIRVDVRVIASTNHDLQEMVRQRRFREDLFFRLNVYAIKIPPLREHADDILVLAEHFIKEFNARLGKNLRKISADARELLLHHQWKGNVRELRNAMERAVLSAEGDVIHKEHICGVPLWSDETVQAPGLQISDQGIDLEALEKHLIQQALKIAKGNKTKAAKLLNLSPPTLYYRIEKYGL